MFKQKLIPEANTSNVFGLRALADGARFTRRVRGVGITAVSGSSFCMAVLTADGINRPSLRTSSNLLSNNCIFVERMSFFRKSIRSLSPGNGMNNIPDAKKKTNDQILTNMLVHFDECLYGGISNCWRWIGQQRNNRLNVSLQWQWLCAVSKKKKNK